MEPTTLCVTYIAFGSHCQPQGLNWDLSLVSILLRCWIFTNSQIWGMTTLSIPTLYLWKEAFFHLDTYLWIHLCNFDLWHFWSLYILTPFPILHIMTWYLKKNLSWAGAKLADKEESFHQCQFLRSQTFSTSGSIYTADMIWVCSTVVWHFGTSYFYLTHSSHQNEFCEGNNTCEIK